MGIGRKNHSSRLLNGKIVLVIKSELLAPQIIHFVLLHVLQQFSCLSFKYRYSHDIRYPLCDDYLSPFSMY